MLEVALFVEDFGHQQIIGALVNRIAQDCGVELRLDWRRADTVTARSPRS